MNTVRLDWFNFIFVPGVNTDIMTLRPVNHNHHAFCIVQYIVLCSCLCGFQQDV